MATYDYPKTPLSGVGVQELAWLTGAWQGSFQADTVDEYWSHAEPGTMVGVYRWVKEGNPWLYEMMLIEAEGDGVVARFKHFHPGLKGLEEAEKHYGFDLVQVNGADAIFHMRDTEPDVWLFYRREDDTLITYYQRDGADPTPETDWWCYHRQG
jgi:hypothetical protein